MERAKGGAKRCPLSGAMRTGRKTDAEWNAKEPPPKGQLSPMAFAARMQTKKQKTITKSLPTTECAMEVGGVEMTTFSSSTTTTPTAATSSNPPASAMVASPVTSSSSSSSSSSSKRQRSSNDDDGAEDAGSGSYHHETLLPPNKAATESSGIAALDGMAEHLVEALKQKLEVPLATAVETVVGRATEQLKRNAGRVFDQAQHEAEAGVARLEEVEAELHRRAGART